MFFHTLDLVKLTLELEGGEGGGVLWDAVHRDRRKITTPADYTTMNELSPLGSDQGHEVPGNSNRWNPTTLWLDVVGR